MNSRPTMTDQNDQSRYASASIKLSVLNSDAVPKYVQLHLLYFYRLPETTYSCQDNRSATSAPHVQTHLCGYFASAYGCLNVGGTRPKVGRRVLADGF